MRAKLDVRWRYGTFLGRSLDTDQNFIGLADGSVIGARAMVRLHESKRWNEKLISGIQSGPMNIKSHGLDAIENDPNPHEHPPTAEDSGDTVADRRRLKITFRDLKK